LFFGVWLLVRGPYTEALAATLDWLAPRIEDPHVTDRVWVPEPGEEPPEGIRLGPGQNLPAGDVVVLSRVVFQEPIHPFGGNFHFGTVIFAALVFATLPNLVVLARLLIVLAGTLVLFATHVAELHFLNQTWYSTLGYAVTGSYTDAQRRFLNATANVFKHGETTFPIALWVFAHFALRHRRRAPRESGPGPASPGA